MTHTQQIGWIAGVMFAAVAAQAPLAGAGETAPEAEPAPAATIQDNMDIGLEYTLTVEGSVVDTTDGRGPFHYVHGQGQLIPGLERELAGLHVGDSKTVIIAPEDAYGPVDPTAFVEVPKEQLPKDVTPTVGMRLLGVADGKNVSAKINEVKDKSVVLDLNHQLAGKTLNFQVKVTAISSAPSPAQ